MPVYRPTGEEYAAPAKPKASGAVVFERILANVKAKYPEYSPQLQKKIAERILSQKR